MSAQVAALVFVFVCVLGSTLSLQQPQDTRGKHITAHYITQSDIRSRRLDDVSSQTLKLASLLSFDEAVLLSLRPASIQSTFSRPTSHSLQPFSRCAFLNFDLDCLSTKDNFKRLSNMLAKARHDEIKEKMQALKDLYTSRHYTQCAKFGERLLSEVDIKVCKHVHCAFPSQPR